MKQLPFLTNGHLAALTDGELATVYEHEDMEPFIPQLSFSRCGTCGALFVLHISANAVCIQDPCPYPDGLTSIITLAVPSGKLIVTDDLRPVYGRWDETGMADYNSELGQHQAIAAMAAKGCAYGPVGNSCPGLYHTGTDSYVIASLSYDQDTDKEQLPGGWQYLAGIITDLWAYSIADYADWLAKGGNSDDLDWTHTVVDVPPGSYRFTHHTGERSFNRDAGGTITFANIERVTTEEEK